MSEHPSTVEEAVERLIEELPEESKEQLRRMEKDEVILPNLTGMRRNIFLRGCPASS